MAIAKDAVIDFFGTQDEVTTTPATVLNGAFSQASDTSQWPNDDNAPTAMFRLVLTQAGLTGAPAVGSVVNLFSQAIGIDGASADQFIPSANFPHTYLGSFPIEDQDIDQQIIIGPIRLPNYKEGSTFIYFIENKMGVDTGTGWELHVIPMTQGPHPA